MDKHNRKMPERELLYDGFVKVERDTETGHEVIVATDSVGILLIDKERRRVILAEQVRDPMKGLTDEQGFLLEVPAGRFDCNLSLIELAIKEVHEETGIRVTKESIEVINGGKPLALCPGILTERMYLVFADIHLDLMDYVKPYFGNPSEGEKIIRIIKDFDEFISMEHQDMKTWALALFLKNYLS